MSSGFADANVARLRPRLTATDSAGTITLDDFSQSMLHGSRSALLRSAISSAARASRYLGDEVRDRSLSEGLSKPTAASRNVIEVEHLDKEFVIGEHTVYAVRDVSFAIAPGEFVAIMGPSGSGKSTLMNIIGCLDAPTSGIYKLDGIDVNTLDNSALARIRNRKIGFIFQHFNLLPRCTAVENVGLPLRYNPERVRDRRQRAMAALTAVGLSGYFDYYPNQMSGGQQQRVAIARAIVNNPPILLADEPTGALDSRTSLAIVELLQKLNGEQAVTILLVTHEQEIASHANRVIRLRDGQLVGDEYLVKPAELVFPPRTGAQPEAGNNFHKRSRCGR